MRSRNRRAVTLFRGAFGARVAPIGAETRVCETGAHRSSPVAVNTRRKLLKTERLYGFQFDAELPSFRAAVDCRKEETVWFICGTTPVQVARHADCTSRI